MFLGPFPLFNATAIREKSNGHVLIVHVIEGIKIKMLMTPVFVTLAIKLSTVLMII